LAIANEWLAIIALMLAANSRKAHRSQRENLMYPIWLVAAGFFIGGASAAIGEEARIRPQEPVIIKPPEDGAGDPCGTGIVRGLDPKGDGFLAVKAGPALHYKRIDKLYNGGEVYLCGYVGDWFAIVYSKEGQYCNVSGGLATEPYPYTGPCRSGWAHKRWIKAVAG
jgi:hypothetical protein